MSLMNVIPRSVSDIIKSEDSDEPKKRSRDEWRKAKELEEARKAGTAPALVDEHGKDINPHIPQYIATTPWYFGSQAPTLKHQRQVDDKSAEVSAIDEYYPRGQKGSAATRYRSGACENCGAITHKKKDCLERPRKVGAKYSGENFVADEVVLPHLSLDYDGKRDRWNGYQPEMYKLVIDEHKKIDDAKRILKEEKLKQDLMIAEKGKEKSVDNVESDSDSDEDEKYADHIDMPGTKVDSKQRITVRNLRIREDTAKYLRNLDPESAFYDPKTRSMRDNPYKNTGKSPEELQYAGENFVRFTGDATNVSNAQLFAWQAYDKGVDIHLQAEPTKAELVHKEFNIKKEDYKENVRDKVLEKYGGEEHLNVPPKELIFAQNENYVEYSRHGDVIKGTKKPIIRSIYEEDVKNNNHTTVWGSFWQNHKWGYKCCHSFIKNSYCTRDVNEQSVPQISEMIEQENANSDNNSNVNNDESSNVLDDENEQLLYKKKLQSYKKLKNKNYERQNNAEDDDDEKNEKLQKALESEEYNNLKAERLLQMDERKRPYNSMYEVKEPTTEEIEAFHIKRKREEDPMAAFLTK